MKRGTGRRLFRVGAHPEIEWTSHALRELAADVAPSLKGGLGFLKKDPTQADVDRAWGLLAAQLVDRAEVENAIRSGENDIDDEWSSQQPGVAGRWFRIPSSSKILRKAILTQALHVSADHDGTLRVITVFVDTTPQEKSSK